MAGSVTTTGLREGRAAVKRLPQAIGVALRAQANATGRRVQATARRILLEKTHGTGATAAEIAVREDAAERVVLVESKARRPAPKNLPGWLEYGTVKMSAKSYMRPAGEAETARHISAVRSVVEGTAARVLG
jgi:hypothetical protein